jgi:hypothetical protein
MNHRASCCCGQLCADCEGEPVRISICHCVDCQRRTGSAFGFQAHYPRAQVTLAGQSATFTRTADSGHAITFSHCPRCGATVYWEPHALPELLTIAVGAFADPHFPGPRHSVYESRQHPWVGLKTAGDIEHLG